MSVDPVSAQGFAEQSLAALRHVTESARDDVRRAAELIVDCVRGDGVVQAFGTGHSQAMVLEVSGRAGGLVPTNRLQMADLVLFGGDDPAVLDDPLLEREPGIAVRLYDLAAPRAEDLFVIISNSGVNSVIVEMALHVKEQGHKILAITSLTHTQAVPAGHASGKKLIDLADVVLDNAAPVGDALLALPGGRCGVRTVHVDRGGAGADGGRRGFGFAARRGEVPPVYVSANVARRLRAESGAGEEVRGADSAYRQLGVARGSCGPVTAGRAAPRAPGRVTRSSLHGHRSQRNGQWICACRQR